MPQAYLSGNFVQFLSRLSRRENVEPQSVTVSRESYGRGRLVSKPVVKCIKPAMAHGWAGSDVYIGVG